VVKLSLFTPKGEGSIPDGLILFYSSKMHENFYIWVFLCEESIVHIFEA
jgi:hypothetical protein